MKKLIYGYMKLQRFYFDDFQPERKKGDLVELKEDLIAHLFTDVGYFVAILKKGFTWNGASVPKIFRWFLPNWHKKKEAFNVLSALHDGGFASGGFNGLFTFDDLNDIYRGGLREIGFGRFKASTACFCITNFSKNHFGQDEYKIRHLCECRKISG